MKFLRQFHCPAAWPPTPFVILFGAAYLFTAGGIWFILRAVTKSDWTPEDNVTLLGYIIFAAVLHALFRLIRFHPACNFQYASWLALSPWSSNKALPLGPIHPVWQDLAVIGCLYALARWHLHADATIPVMAFVITYLAGLSLLLTLTQVWPFFFAAGFLWPSLLLTIDKPFPTAIICAALVLVLWFGTRKSLKTFPWTQQIRKYPGMSRPAGQNSLLNREIRIENGHAFGMSSLIGWPYASLSPKPRFRPISTWVGFWISLLIAWWVYCVIKASDAEPTPGLILVIGLCGAMARIICYFGGIIPPFTFYSRFVTGRLIVPRFDQVFVVPLAAVAMAITGDVIVSHWHSFYAAFEASFIFLIFFVLLVGKPAMRNWVLTGQHRFWPAFARSKNSQLFRPV